MAPVTIDEQHLTVSFGKDTRLGFPDGSSVTFMRPDPEGFVKVVLHHGDRTLTGGMLSASQAYCLLTGLRAPAWGDDG